MRVPTASDKPGGTALWLSLPLLWLLLLSGCKGDPPQPPMKRRELPAAAASVALDQVSSAIAAVTASAGTEPCVHAWLELSELARRNPTAAPPQKDFVTRCRKLPAPAQACMSLSHALQEPSRCSETMAALSPAQRRLASELLAGQ